MHQQECGSRDLVGCILEDTLWLPIDDHKFATLARCDARTVTHGTCVVLWDARTLVHKTEASRALLDFETAYGKPRYSPHFVFSEMMRIVVPSV